MRDIAAGFREYIRLERKSASEGLTPAELRQWTNLKRRLSRQFTPGISDDEADRRASVRVPARLAVSLPTVGALRKSLLTNLSRGGFFVATEHAVPIGTRLVLRIHVEENDDVLEVPAEVVTHDVGPGLDNTKQGMGMRFGALSGELQKRVDDLYERTLRRAGGCD